MKGIYDEIGKRVNEKISKLGKSGTFVDLAKIDKKLRLPRGTSFDAAVFSDYFAFEDED